MQKRRIISIIVTIAVLLSMFSGMALTVNAAKPEKLFSDVGYWEDGGTENVAPAHWGSPYIYPLAEKKIVEGYTDVDPVIFKPDNEILRREFAVILTKVFGVYDKEANIRFATEPSVQAKDSSDAAESSFNPSQEIFSDVNPSDWFYSYVASAVEAGLASGEGMGNGTFGQELPMTRTQMMIFFARGIVKYLGYSFPEAEETAEILSVFDDAYTVPDWTDAAESVALCKKLGLVNGYKEDEVFRIKAGNNITRAEVCAIVLRMIKFMENLILSTPSPKPEEPDQELTKWVTGLADVKYSNVSIGEHGKKDEYLQFVKNCEKDVMYITNHNAVFETDHIKITDRGMNGHIKFSGTGAEIYATHLTDKGQLNAAYPGCSIILLKPDGTLVKSTHQFTITPGPIYTTYAVHDLQYGEYVVIFEFSNIDNAQSKLYGWKLIFNKNDPAVLEDVIADGLEKMNGLYTSESKAELNRVLEAGKSVLNAVPGRTGAQIEAAVDEIIAVISALKVDLAACQTKIDEAKQFLENTNLDDYTDLSIQELRDEIKTCQAAIDNHEMINENMIESITSLEKKQQLTQLFNEVKVSGKFNYVKVAYYLNTGSDWFNQYSALLVPGKFGLAGIYEGLVFQPVGDPGTAEIPANNSGRSRFTAVSHAKAVVFRFTGIRAEVDISGFGTDGMLSDLGWGDHDYAMVRPDGSGIEGSAIYYDNLSEKLVLTAPVSGDYVVLVGFNADSKSSFYGYTTYAQEPGNKLAFSNKAAEAKSYAETDYTPASYKALKDAIVMADALLVKAGAKQSSYDAAAAAIDAAIGELEELTL